MYIYDFNCGWFDYFFLINVFYVKDQVIVDKIVNFGICELYIDMLKGVDVWVVLMQYEVNVDFDW